MSADRKKRPPDVVRLSDLTPPQRRVIEALLAQKKAAP